MKKLSFVIAFGARVAMATVPQSPDTVQGIVVNSAHLVSRAAVLSMMHTKIGDRVSLSGLESDRQSLMDCGYFASVDLRLTAVEGGCRVDVAVAENTTIREFRFAGNSILKPGELVAAIRPLMKVGDVYNTNARVPAAFAIQKCYTNRGYQALVTDFGSDPKSPHTVAISVKELRVGALSIEGSAPGHVRLLCRLIRSHPGRPFSAQQWSDDVRKVNATGLFEEVEPREDLHTTEPGIIDLKLRVKERDPVAPRQSRTEIIDRGSAPSSPAR